MTYTKPNNMTYTEICQWVDANAYTENCDELKLYEYLYHIVHMLAVKDCMFQSWRDYDDFSLMGATRLFMRIKNEGQFRDDTDSKKLNKIKSILNYTKKILHPMRVNYARERGNKSVDNQAQNQEIIDMTTFQQQLRDTVEGLSIVDFNCYMQDIPKTIKAYLKNIPQEKGKAEWDNIYLSCLLSILNSITLPNAVLIKLKTLPPMSIKQNYIEKLYHDERQNSTILFHLPENMLDYVTVLVNKLRRIIIGDLVSILHVYIPTTVGMENLMSSAIEEDFADND